MIYIFDINVGQIELSIHRRFLKIHVIYSSEIDHESNQRSNNIFSGIIF